MSKKLLVLDHAPEVGGAQMALARLVRQLPSDWTTHTVASRGSGTAQEYAHWGSVVETDVSLAAPQFRRDSGLVALLKSVPTLAKGSRSVYRWMRHHKPAVALANTPKSLLIALLPAKLSRTPLLWFVRDRVSKEYVPNTLARTALLWLGKHVIRGMIYNSHSTKALMAHEGAVVYSPIDDTYFASEVAEPVASTIRFVAIGRIDDVKGQDLVVEALARLVDTPWELFVLGEGRLGHGGSETKLRNLISALGVGEKCHLVGHVSNVADYIDDAHVVVHYSRLPEALGQVMIQGMARGRCVVASAGGGASELIDDYVDGVLVQPNDPGALADVLAKVARDGDLRARLGANARMSAMQFRLDVCGAAFTDVLEAVSYGRSA